MLTLHHGTIVFLLAFALLGMFVELLGDPMPRRKD